MLSFNFRAYGYLLKLKYLYSVRIQWLIDEQILWNTHAIVGGQHTQNRADLQR